MNKRLLQTVQYEPIYITEIKRYFELLRFSNSFFVFLLAYTFISTLGSESSYRHQLRGYLAGLAYLPGSNENEDVLKCLHQCAESLQIPAVTNSVSSGTEMLIDSKGSVVKVDGKKAKDVASMVNSILTPNHSFGLIDKIS